MPFDTFPAGGPLVSVIIPAYNTDGYLARCLDSVLGQTYPRLQVIVVDDGSMDGTGALADSYAGKDKRVMVIHQENAGVSMARAAGIKAASGDFIAFADSDDEQEKDMLELLVGNALKYDADISHCGYKMVFPSRVDEYHNTGQLLIRNRVEGLRDLLEGTLVEPGLWDKIYRRRLFEDVNFDTSVRNLEDLLLNFVLFSKAKCSVFHDVTKYRYILRPGSAATSAASIRKFDDVLQVADSIARLSADDPETAPLGRMKRLGLYISLYDQTLEKTNPEIAARKGMMRARVKAGLGDAALLPPRARLMAYAITLCPALYGPVRKAYDVLSGNKNKYKVD